jgi:hypothetical protein
MTEYWNAKLYPTKIATHMLCLLLNNCCSDTLHILTLLPLIQPWVLAPFCIYWNGNKSRDLFEVVQLEHERARIQSPMVWLLFIHSFIHWIKVSLICWSGWHQTPGLKSSCFNFPSIWNFTGHIPHLAPESVFSSIILQYFPGNYFT